MKWVIIIGVMLSLLGSLMWVMPTPKQKYQARLRLKARELGLNVSLARLELPRARGEMEAETVSVPAYRQLRMDIERKDAERLLVWQAAKVDAIASDGLLDGWSWVHGEGVLDEAQLACVNELLENVPEGIVSLECNPVHVTAYWNEKGDEAGLLEVQALLEKLADLKFEAAK